MSFLLALDQGTTSSRAVVVKEDGNFVATAQREFRQHFPRSGWVEHDAKEIWETVRATAWEAWQAAGSPAIAGIGITNQRETSVVWDRATGDPVGPAIVWQDRRTAERLAALGSEAERVRAKTGLELDPYFSASKLEWILDNTDGVRARAERGELAAGTIDTWLIFKLTGKHLTDVTNASRTMLMNIHTLSWDDDLLATFRVPRALLPEIVPSTGPFGTTLLLGSAVPVAGVAGDQQAALFGQMCFEPGLVKCTYGTGCFMLLFTGTRAVESRNRLLTTVAWQIKNQPASYALEGSVFVGGAAIQWLRDGLGIIRTAPEVNDLAASVPDAGGTLFVPALTGLGAPYWDSSARGAYCGITRGTTSAHLARATLEGIAYQVADLVGAMESDAGVPIARLRVDGGASASDLLMQIQADLLGVPVERPRTIESTALGAALLAGLGVGLWASPDDLLAVRAVDRAFAPATTAEHRRARLERWRAAVQRARSWEAA